MKISFLGQGFEDKSVDSVGNHILKSLKQKDYHSFFGISAFASESGVYGLAQSLNATRSNFKSINLIVGVDLQGTSREALEEILALNIGGYVFYQKEQPIFHPKIYIFEGPKKNKIIIGSSNLTRGGLFTNVESSVMFEYDSTDMEGTNLLLELKNYYKSLFNFSDPNLFRITATVIADFYSDGIIPDETTRRKSFQKGALSGNSSSSFFTSKLVVSKRLTSKVPASFPSKQKSSGPRPMPFNGGLSSVQSVKKPLIQKNLVWQKLSLSKSDAQFVPAGTNGTGNLKLSQAGFHVNGSVIDQTTYFRNKVFNTLNWVQTKPNNKSYEEAFCLFHVMLLGKKIGSFTLKLSHDSVRIAGQGNTPTWLHWGNAILPFLQSNNIAGKTLNLYYSNQLFLIEIV